jgi:inositol 1,4,5-triphosphate receptor type 1
MTMNRFGLIGREKAVVVGNGIKFQTWSITAATYYLLSKKDSWYYITLLVFALVGYLVTPATYCICMVEVLRISKLMQYVSRAFTENIDQVVATIILAGVIMYLFVNVAFAVPQLHNRYSFDELGENGCFSLQTCLRLHLDYGMLQSIKWKYDANIPTALGEVFNFFLTFIMQIVIPGLISGIIIDTFSEMRNAKQQIEGDVFNNCFICNIARDDFEAAGVPFEQHIKNDHNMWKYLWFLIYLDEKDHTEFDGIEQFCATLDIGSTRWLPIRKARVLSNMRERYDLFTLYQKVSSLQSSLDVLHSGFKSDLTAQEKTIREIVKSENQDMEKGLRELDDTCKTIRKTMGKRRSRSSGSSSSSSSSDDESYR